MATDFTLIIDIRGLCLLVPHQDKLHVLMPETRHHPSMVHTTRLKFRPEHDHPSTPSGRLHEEFDGFRWDLSGLGTSIGSIPTTIVPTVDDYAGRRIPASQLVEATQRKVSSHLILGRGEMMCHGKIAFWEIGNDTFVPMTNKIRWVISDVPGTQLDWEFKRLGGAGHRPRPLYPNARRIIHIDLLHAPPGEHTGTVGQERCRPLAGRNHFHMFYDLYDLPTGGQTPPEPRCMPNVAVVPPNCPEPLVGPPATLIPPSTAQPVDEYELESQVTPRFERGPNVFSCMLGQAKVDPNS